MPDTATSTEESRAREAAYRRAYRRGFRKRKALSIPDEKVTSNAMESLEVLLSLEVSDPSTLPRLAKGLRWHVAYGTLTANAAAQIVRLAELELAATRKKPQGSPLAGRFAKVATQGGKITTNEVVKIPERTQAPHSEVSPGSEVSPESGQSEGAAPSDSSACAGGRPSESQGA